MGKTAYLAIDYICNENCLFCPCSKSEKKAGMIAPFAEIQESIDHFFQDGIERIVISGGEPTLHPNLGAVIGYAQGKGMDITLLSNGELFSNPNFLRSFLDEVDIAKLTVITTFHSHLAQEHERANQTPGSFQRSLRGLHPLSAAKATIVIKHCITRMNYQELKNFYEFFDSLFPETVSMQLCGIDYCGIPKEQLEEEMLSFTEIKPYLETLFDAYLVRQKEGCVRNLYCINMPLCCCDAYYWPFIRKKPQKTYQAYKDPRNRTITNAAENVGAFGDACKTCAAFALCSGTYRTAFEAFGDRIVKPYKR